MRGGGFGDGEKPCGRNFKKVPRLVLTGSGESLEWGSSRSGGRWVFFSLGTEFQFTEHHMKASTFTFAYYYFYFTPQRA